MPGRWVASLGAIALAGAGAALAAQSQDQDAPESLLPEGFGDPAPPPPADRPRPQTPPPPAGTPPPASRPGEIVQPLPGLPTAPGLPTPSPTPTPTATPLTAAELLQYDLPDYARRSTARVGAIGLAEGGLPANGFGRSDGRFLEGLMRRLDAPIASRWLSITLRRMLVSRLDTPANVNGADFAAERAWLLLRMGEAQAARDVVNGVDTENFTPKLDQVAMQAALATADPAMLCPLQPFAMARTRDTGWRLAEAMCAGLSGEPSRAGKLIDAARRQRAATGIDLLLAEKVLGAGAQGRRAVTIEWDGVDRLSAWRWGLATASGVAVPDTLLASAGPQVRGWAARAASIAPPARLRDADWAASQGVLSNLAMVDLWSQVEDADGTSNSDASIARDLRAAYTSADMAERVSILAQLWSEASDPRQRHARMVLAARAAAGIRPAEAQAASAGDLIASMLTAGLDRPAARWRPFVEAGSQGWALIALTDPDAGAAVGQSEVNAYRGAVDERRAQLFFAGVAGLGRVEAGDIPALAQAFGVPINAENGWVRAIRGAAERREPATVVLLAAVGMQTPDWGGVAPAALFHIVAALRQVGLEGEARMIAAEAVSRA
ncbi:hypothetical protein COC42_09025 [Sphingomonas spermidinifaciens]|uniref:Antifreeze protein n=1 Tax=Sphingomonas spermidinifaciens TaxID=1141889 RepID=A0A2A4B9Q0_9SPHN|nr:hypothetical protein [Sphingomonas spermidinifaciens]PCD04396.1 hypothetical protein COC42_09025 [Sphingomonas spermidinifaciens]